MAHTVLATFPVRAGATDRLAALLDRHYATIARLEGAIGQASQHAEVQALWGEIDACCEARGDLPGLDFPQVERLR